MHTCCVFVLVQVLSTARLAREGKLPCKPEINVLLIGVGAVQSRNENIHFDRGCLPEPLLQHPGELPVGNHGRYVYKKYFDFEMGRPQLDKMT